MNVSLKQTSRIFDNWRILRVGKIINTSSYVKNKYFSSVQIQTFCNVQESLVVVRLFMYLILKQFFGQNIAKNSAQIKSRICESILMHFYSVYFPKENRQRPFYRESHKFVHTYFLALQGSACSFTEGAKQRMKWYCCHDT